MAITGNTALVATKQDLIAALVQKELIEKSQLAGQVFDVSRFAVKGAKSISFPKAGHFTVENRASGAAATIQNLTFAADKLDLSFRATVSWLIDSMDELESVLDVDAEYAQRAAAAHALYVDTQIITAALAAGVEQTTVGTAITKALVLEMREMLKRKNANMQNLSLVIAPEQETEMLAINEFVSADVYGSARIPSGALGAIFGVPVTVVNGLVDGSWFMYDRDAIALGFQKAPMMDERKAPEYGTGSLLKVLDQKFGVKALFINQEGVGASESALIVKNNPS